MIDLEQLKADHAAGTKGPWHKNNGNVHAMGRCVARLDWDIRDDIDHVNARRIARLPELEAAYIEAVGLLRRWATGTDSAIQETRKFLIKEN